MRTTVAGWGHARERQHTRKRRDSPSFAHTACWSATCSVAPSPQPTAADGRVSRPLKERVDMLANRNARALWLSTLFLGCAGQIDTEPVAVESESEPLEIVSGSSVGAALSGLTTDQIAD